MKVRDMKDQGQGRNKQSVILMRARDKKRRIAERERELERERTVEYWRDIRGYEFEPRKPTTKEQDE